MPRADLFQAMAGDSGSYAGMTPEQVAQFGQQRQQQMGSMAGLIANLQGQEREQQMHAEKMQFEHDKFEADQLHKAAKMQMDQDLNDARIAHSEAQTKETHAREKALAFENELMNMFHEKEVETNIGPATLAQVTYANSKGANVAISEDEYHEKVMESRDADGNLTAVLTRINFGSGDVETFSLGTVDEGMDYWYNPGIDEVQPVPVGEQPPDGFVTKVPTANLEGELPLSDITAEARARDVGKMRATVQADEYVIDAVENVGGFRLRMDLQSDDPETYEKAHERARDIVLADLRSRWAGEGRVVGGDGPEGVGFYLLRDDGTMEFIRGDVPY